MNWEFLMSFALAFGLMFVIFMTLGFYISYKRDKNIPKDEVHHDPKKGRYFKRFIPDSLKSKYENTSSRREYLKEVKYYQRVTRAIVLIPIGIFLVAIVFTWKRYGDYVFSPVRLAPADLEKIKMTSHEWINPDSALTPNIESLRAEFFGRRIVVVSDSGFNEFSPVVRSAIQSVEKTFSDLGRMFGVQVKNCDWKGLDACQKRSSKNIYVVLPGRWNEEKLSDLYEASSRIIFVGPPVQAAESSTGGWSWKGLAFRRAERGTGDIVVRADQACTIGLDPGRRLNLSAVDSGFQVETKDAQAFRMRDDQRTGARPSAAWAAGVDGQTKWVWIDFVPDLNSPNTSMAEASRIALGGVFRFLFDVSVESISSWPNGNDSAGIVVVDVVEDFDAVDSLLDSVGDDQAPMSFFIASKVAERNRAATKRFVQFGELNCISNDFTDLSTADLKKQSLRLAECRKAALEVANAQATGVHPPFENYNPNTLSAIYNSGFSFFVSGLETQYSPRMLLDSAGEGRLIQVPRASRSLGNRTVSGSNTLDLSAEVSGDMAWVQKLGGLYVLNFSDVSLADDGSSVILELLKQYQKAADKVWLATAGDVNRWWRVRESLIRNVPVADAEVKKFKPTKIMLTKDGRIESKTN